MSGVSRRVAETAHSRGVACCIRRHVAKSLESFHEHFSKGAHQDIILHPCLPVKFNKSLIKNLILLL